MQSSDDKKQNLVILGGGWGGFRLLKGIDLNKYNVFVVTPRNHFLFTPLLPGSAAGTVEFRSIIEPLRRARVHPDYHFFEASCEEIDTANQTVDCSPLNKGDPHFTLKYDKLVVAVGCDVNTFNIPGVKEHSYFMKELGDARRVRSKLIENFERASNPNTPVHLKEQLLHIVVVGAGPTGVELSAEIHDLITQDLRRYFPPETIVDVRMTILEASETLLGAFDSTLQKQTMKVFMRDGIKVRLHKKVQQVLDKNTLLLDDGSKVECGMIIWSAGIQARELLMKGHETLPIDPRSRKLLVDDSLKVKGFDNVYAMGDCSMIESRPLAATAQVAQQQGKYLSKLLNNDKYDKQFIYHHQGLMAYIGDYRAVTELGEKQHKHKFGGYLAWIFWRSAYLTKLVSFKNKVLVPFNWMITFFFGRDISRF